MEPYIVAGGLFLAVSCGLFLSLCAGRPRVSRRELDRLNRFQISAGPYVINPADVSAAWRDVE